MKTPYLDAYIETLEEDAKKGNNSFYENRKLSELREIKKQLGLCNVVKSLPIQNLPNCTRVEVIDQNGRSYVNWKPTNKVRLSMQDDGKTAKIFID